jgi:PAS domain S-box-containing protein
LKRLGYAVSAAVYSGEEAIREAEERHPDLVLMDIRLKGDMDGVEAAEQIRDCFNIPVVYLTAYADEGTLQRAKVTTPFGYILKPFSEKELNSIIQMALYRHEMDKRLKESEEKYRQLFSTETDAIIVFDGDTRQCTDANNAALHLYGYNREELLQLKVTDISAEPELTDISVRETIAGKIDRIPLRYHKKKDGTIFPVEISSSTFMLGNRKVLCGAVRDITERKRAEEEREKLEAQLQRAEKMEAIGTLAGQVAHDLNNVLSDIVSYPDLVLMQLPEDSPLREPILTIQKSGQRAAAIVQDLLALARREDFFRRSGEPE